MKKLLFKSNSSETNTNCGESYASLFTYLYPEFITAFLLYSALGIIDSLFIAQLSQCSAYATLGVVNTLFHFITKVAEGISVGMVILCGQYNGIADFKKVGQAVKDAFWSTIFIGLIVATLLYFCAYWIYAIFYAVPSDMIALGVPFLRLRALGIFFHFIYFALIGFLRGIKNTWAPMYFFAIGAIVFIFFDYALIFGEYGFPMCGLQGSAWASIIQYGVMLVLSLVYILSTHELRRYSICLYTLPDISLISNLFSLSWPIILDKASVALCHIWLAKIIGLIAKSTTSSSSEIILASFTVLKDMERFALLPAIACAQVITFLVSNDYRMQNWLSIKNNVQKILLIACSMCAAILLAFSLWPRFFISFVDKAGNFTEFAARVMPIICLLLFLDFLQLLLAACLRGAAQVKVVMSARLAIIICYFLPLTSLVLFLPITDVFYKFILVYGLFYTANGLMCAWYIKHFFGHKKCDAPTA